LYAGVLCILATGKRWALWKDTGGKAQLARWVTTERRSRTSIRAGCAAGINPGTTYYQFAIFSLAYNCGYTQVRQTNGNK
jgi:hypothetical protein